MELAPKRTRNTIQRKAVQEAIRSLAGCHPTAAEVYATVRMGHPQLSLATVYRALHALVEQRAIIEMYIDNVTRYDVGMAESVPEALPHHHVTCRHCGSVTDVCASAVSPHFLRAVEAAAEGFALDFHPIQFRGVCPECQAATSSSAR
ncbi:MAG: transcriptional repressor [Armatimonadota bacterium]